jgi:modulator of FtsH protease
MAPFTPTLAAWQPFFAAQLGAGAALLGLLFVGLSLNLSRILAAPSLPLRAEIGPILLALQLVVSSLMLVPDLGPRVTGLALLVLAAATWLVTTRLALGVLRTTTPAERRHNQLALLLLQLALLPYLAGARCSSSAPPAPSTSSPSA